MQLIEISDQFEDLGVNIAVMTYDPVDFLKDVELDRGATFPLLHDEDITHVNRIGILNTDYEPGTRAYGVPYPGIFLIDTDGVIRYKFAEERYQDRPEFANVVEAAAEMASQ